MKPAGKVAAASEKDPPPNKSQAATLAQRQAQRRGKFGLSERPLFFTDPDFENVVDLTSIMKFLPLPLILGCQFAAGGTP
jgi:hypothetical protein